MQVPLTAPAGTAQVPAQQSALTVHLAPVHAHGAAQLPLVAPGGMMHTLPAAQHSGVVVQLWPIIEQGGGSPHAPSAHVPEQHGTSMEHATPFAMHGVGAPQRSTPPASGTQGKPSQHCPLNWQTSPGGMHNGPAGSPGAQRCFVHTPEQHSQPSEHFAPDNVHVGGGWQVPAPSSPAEQNPVQQSDAR
jgi:hypothetical protein